MQAARPRSSGGLEGHGAAQELRRAVRHAARIARRQKGRRAAARHAGMAGEVVREAFGHQRGLGVDGDLRAERVPKGRFDEGIVRAAQHRRVGPRHLAHQRLDMGARQRLGEDQVALLDGVHDAAAGLRLHVHADGAERKLALERARGDRGRRGEERDVAHRDLTRGRVVAPAPLGQRLDQRHEHAEHALALGHPRLLHPAQRHRRGGVAGEHHDVAAPRPQILDPRARQLVDAIGRARAVGRVGVVAVVDDGQVGQPARDGAQHREPAEPAVEHAQRHPGRPLRASRRSARSGGPARAQARPV